MVDQTQNSDETVSTAYLVPFPEESGSKPILLTTGSNTIGRDPANTIHLSQGGISRNHAKISFSAGRYILTDLKSRNGCYVNRKRVEQTALRNQDKVFFGNRGFIFLIDSVQPSRPTEQPDLVSSDTITISEEEIELTDWVAHNVDAATQTFLQSFLREGGESDDELHLAHERLVLLYELNDTLRLVHHPNEIMDRGLEFIIRALHAAERAVCLLRSEPSNAFEVRRVKHRGQIPTGENVPVSRTVLEHVMTEKVALVSRNVLDDSLFADSDSIMIHNWHSIICVPLICDQTVIGIIQVDTSNYLEPLTQNDMEFASAVANEMAMSIENIRLQEKAIQNETMAAIGLTITNLAHNIKNLMTLNVNATQLMDMYLEELEEDKIHLNWRLIKQSIDRISELTSDMIEYAQSQPLNLKAVDINSTILSHFAFYRDNLSQMGIELDLDFDSNLPEWPMDDVLLQRALINLVVNAKDAVADVQNARITIATRLDGSGQLRIRISDNGCGIQPDKLQNIFQLFYTTKGTKGSGLGLPMVHKFAESMGGHLTVESQPDEGTTFSLIFPPKDR